MHTQKTKSLNRNLSLMLKIIGFSLALFTTTFARSPWDKVIEPTPYWSADIRTTRNIDLNLIGAEYRFGKLITRTRVLSTTLIYDSGLLASYNALPQIILFFGGNFNAYPTESDVFIQSALNLLNGDVGYEGKFFETGITNSIDLFFTRRAYHRAGAYFSVGGRYKATLSVFEEDRFRYKTPKLGIGFTLVKKLDSL